MNGFMLTLYWKNMRRSDAKKIAEKISNEDLMSMVENAKNSIFDWTKIAACNKSLTKGTAWNILCKDFTLTSYVHILGKINMIREFGEYLPEQLKPIKKPKYIVENPIHQDPIFLEHDIVMSTYVKCFDKFGKEIHDGDWVDVQTDGTQIVYKKEDGQLYFKPYGGEDRVSAYFSNDLIKL